MVYANIHEKLILVGPRTPSPDRMTRKRARTNMSSTLESVSHLLAPAKCCTRAQKKREEELLAEVEVYNSDKISEFTEEALNVNDQA